ncbi:hypothetical protein HDZ31DRAFT_35461 [Schizophyllum fasciatum]
MTAVIEDRMQTLSLLDPSAPSAHESQKKVTKRRRERPQFHKRLHPSHADLPYIPVARDSATHRYWHFGWPLSDKLVDDLLDTYIPEFLDDDHPMAFKYGRFTRLAKTLTQCEHLFLVLVEPDAFAPSQSPFADPGEQASTFLMVVSDQSVRFFNNRPTKEQMARLTRMFGSEPRWMMDAREKKRWCEYGHARGIRAND